MMTSPVRPIRRREFPDLSDQQAHAVGIMPSGTR
jgi:hypothetical protein